jgi:hypothetical protein
VRHFSALDPGPLLIRAQRDQRCSGRRGGSIRVVDVDVDVDCASSVFTEYLSVRTIASTNTPKSLFANVALCVLCMDGYGWLIVVRRSIIYCTTHERVRMGAIVTAAFQTSIKGNPLS